MHGETKDSGEDTTPDPTDEGNTGDASDDATPDASTGEDAADSGVEDSADGAETGEPSDSTADSAADQAPDATSDSAASQGAGTGRVLFDQKKGVYAVQKLELELSAPTDRALSFATFVDSDFVWQEDQFTAAKLMRACPVTHFLDAATNECLPCPLMSGTT